ncbi:NAD(P)/FAD-dependent oxidoreductase [Pleionea sp. CnH1-48]|uniref:phytoene desaturase family protein n=1 Tax=Pleionea sp. CnH1-48 TaxID=2954494 RepID=UPI00209730C9|nr:NAD(P)/FAD-dependent oxidoreductase [Pleionea sp. CnH1-48]MCO7224277.1 NAD(P)/FAD-dependent oxidoreductase [Pleionea sp. CnH1-48]
MSSDNDVNKKKKRKVNVRTGRRYRSGRADEHYDVIVIGSGIGGLANAALLSLLGKKVCVLEQHYTAGGFTHAYEREGYEWDVGVHYIGEVHKPYSTLRRIFDVVSEGRLKWQEMDSVYDRIIIGDEAFDFKAGRQEFIDSLVKRFPEEESAIKQYVDLIRKMSALSPRFFAAQAMPAWMGRIYNRVKPWFLPKECFMKTREVLEGLTSNQKLISVLTGQWGDYGQIPESAAFIMHALVAKHYLAGGAYPVGGASAIARTIIPTIQKSGGEVFTYAEVDEVVVENNTAIGVRMVTGDVIKADKIVSNAGFLNTANRLLPEASRQRWLPQDWKEKVKPSIAHLCLYAGFKGDTNALDLSSTNLWIYPDGDHEGNFDRYLSGSGENIPFTYVSFPSTKDPDWDERYPNKSTVEVVTLANMDWYQSWQGTQWQQRGDDYEAYKERLSQELLERLYKHVPQLRDALDYYELSTPLSTEFYQLNQFGEIYGLDHSMERFDQPFLHPQTAIKNFYLTGADVVTAGVGGALMGGLMTTMSMEGLLKARKITRLLKDYQPQDFPLTKPVTSAG